MLSRIIWIITFHFLKICCYRVRLLLCNCVEQCLPIQYFFIFTVPYVFNHNHQMCFHWTFSCVALIVTSVDHIFFSLKNLLYINIKKLIRSTYFSPKLCYNYFDNLKCCWQCCGSGSGIRCFIDPWIRDRDPDPGSGMEKKSWSRI